MHRHLCLTLDSGDVSLPTRPSHSLVHALLLLSSELQQLGVRLDDDWRQQQAGSTLRRFVTVCVDRLEPSTSPGDNGVQCLWDLTFLQKLYRLWGPDTTTTSERIEASISRQRDVGPTGEMILAIASHSVPFPDRQRV